MAGGRPCLGTEAEFEKGGDHAGKDQEGAAGRGRAGQEDRGIQEQQEGQPRRDADAPRAFT